MRTLSDIFSLGDRIPEGSSGEWYVKRRTPSERDVMFSALRDGYRSLREGTYTTLCRGGTIVMSDTPAEMRDHYEPFLQAERRGGRVLIHGLGLGMVLGAVLRLPQVKRVDVVELSEDVIYLVAPAYREHADAGRLTIHHANCLEKKWPVGSRWSVVWHDIWNEICEDNLPEMTTLHRKFGRRCDWQGSWSREEVLRERRRTAGAWWR